MANHVYNYITVEGNEAVQKEWTKLFPHYGELVERPSYHGDGTIQMWEYHEIQKHPFLEGYEEREKARWDKNYIDTDAERDVQNKYSDVSEKWNKTH